MQRPDTVGLQIAANPPQRVRVSDDISTSANAPVGMPTLRFN